MSPGRGEERLATYKNGAEIRTKLIQSYPNVCGIKNIYELATLPFICCRS